MVCIIESKYQKEIEDLTGIIGDRETAISLLCANNGFTLDKTPQGEPSDLYQQLLGQFSNDGAGRRRAIIYKARTFGSSFVNKYGKWFEQGAQSQNNNFDSNGEPVLSIVLEAKNLFQNSTEQDFSQLKREYVSRLVNELLFENPNASQIEILNKEIEAQQEWANQQANQLDEDVEMSRIDAEDTKRLLKNENILIGKASKAVIQMFRKAKERAKKLRENLNIKNLNLKDDLSNKIDETANQIISATISKEKAYKSKNFSSSTSYGDINQQIQNQENSRKIRGYRKSIIEAQNSKNAKKELDAKLEMFLYFIENASDEINKILSMLLNAEANEYRKIYYKVDNVGNIIYNDENNKYYTEQNEKEGVQYGTFDFNDLQYINTDVIGFYDGVLHNILLILDQLDENDPKVKLLKDSIRISDVCNNIFSAKRKYQIALENKVMDMVRESLDEIPEERLDSERKARLIVRTKKWLRNQYDFGDVTVFERVIGIGSRSKSSLIRLIQEVINQIENDIRIETSKKGFKLNDLYRKALNKNKKYMLPGMSLQQLLMGKDRNGLPNGDFVRPINYRQYQQDLENIQAELLFGKDGIRDRIANLKDDSGNYVFRDPDTNTYEIEFDEHGEPILPNHPKLEQAYKNYYKKLESWKCDHSERPYTRKYYIERLDHLSISTIQMMNKLYSGRNEIIQAATVDGQFRPDKLSDFQLDELNRYNQEIQQLSSHFYIDGTEKDPYTPEGIAAREISSWQNTISDHIKYKTSIEKYNQALSFAKDKKKFARLFSKWIINPKLYEWLDDDFQMNNSYVKSLKKTINKLMAPYKTDKIGEVKWDMLFDFETGKIKNEKWFESMIEVSKRYSEEISLQYKDHSNEDDNGGTKYNELIDEVYVPKPGFQYDFSYTYEDSMLKYMKDAYQNYLVENKGYSTQQASSIAANTFSYTYMTAKGKSVNKPISIFMMRVPKEKKQFKGTDGNYYKSFIRTPSSMFSEIDLENSSSDYINKNYDRQSDQTLQPKESIYRDENYYKYIEGKKEMKELYDELISTMEQSFQNYPFVKKYDYRLPQRGETRNSSILSRNLLTRLGVNVREVLDRTLSVNENDLDINFQEQVLRPDGTPIKNIPIRWIRRLSKPEYISSDIIGSVTLMYGMSVNYKLKNQKVSQVESILNYIRSNDPSSSSKQAEAIQGMIDRQFYEEQTSGLKVNPTPEQWKHADWFRRYFWSAKSWLKKVGQIRGIAQLGMLAFNLGSGIVSSLDATTSMVIDVLTGKYINYKDLSYAFSQLMFDLPKAINSLGKIKTDSDICAQMQYFGLAKGNTQTFRNTDYSKLRRFLSDGLLMKQFAIGDYTINALNMTSVLHNYRLYVDQNGKRQLLNKPDFIRKAINDGMTYKQAKSAYNSAKIAKRFLKRGKDGMITVDKEFEKDMYRIGQQIRSRSSIYNGVINDAERTYFQSNVWLSLISMLRNFFIVGIWERFQTYRDFQMSVEQTFDPETGEILNEYGGENLNPQQAANIKKEQRYYAGGYNFDTGQIENGTTLSFFRYLSKLYPYLKYSTDVIFSGMSKYDPQREQYLKNNNLNAQEIYGAQKITMEFTAAMLFILASASIYRIAKTKDPDDDDSYLWYLINYVLVRLPIERFTWMSLDTVNDLINSITAASSDLKRKGHLIDMVMEALGLSKHKLTDEMPSNSQYAGQQRWFYHLCNIGSSFGLHNYYVNMPKALGGGGAKPLMRKAYFYYDKLPFGNYIYDRGKKTDKVDKRKKNVGVSVISDDSNDGFDR